jgi:hypothetical protein
MSPASVDGGLGDRLNETDRICRYVYNPGSVIPGATVRWRARKPEMPDTLKCIFGVQCCQSASLNEIFGLYQQSLKLRSQDLRLTTRSAGLGSCQAVRLPLRTPGAFRPGIRRDPYARRGITCPSDASKDRAQRQRPIDHLPCP